MFLLRCGFWLSLVYAGLLWPGAPFGRPIDQHAVERPGDRAPARGWHSDLGPRVARQAVDYCQTHAQICLASAARLNSLVEAVSRSDEAAFLSDSAAPAPPRSPPTVKPLPPHRPARAGSSHYASVDR